MSLTVYGQPYLSSSSFSSGDVVVKMKATKNTIMKAVRTWLCFYNIDNTEFTNVTMKLYYWDAVNEGAGDLIASSTTTHTRTTLGITEKNCISHTYFNFNEIALQKDHYYGLAISGTSTGFDETKHLAWITSYPYPIYEGYSASFTNLPKAPPEIAVIGADF